MAPGGKFVALFDSAKQESELEQLRKEERLVKVVSHTFRHTCCLNTCEQRGPCSWTVRVTHMQTQLLFEHLSAPLTMLLSTQYHTHVFHVQTSYCLCLQGSV